MPSPNPHAIDADTLSGMRRLRKVVYSIGSNLGDRLGNLQGAVDALSDTPDVILVDISSVYETEPVGGPADNPGCSSTWSWSPRPRARPAHPVGAGAGHRGRVRPRPPGDQVGTADAGRRPDQRRRRGGGSGVDPEALHPLAHERAFVLVPWYEIDPTGEIQGKGAIGDLLAQADTSGVVRRDDLVIERD